MENYNSKFLIYSPSAKKSPMNLNIFILLFLTLIFAFLIISPAEAALLYFSPQNGQYHQNDVFSIEIKLDTEGESINLGQITVNFSPEHLGVVNISTGGSIFTLWPETPIFSDKEGLVSFVGGAPGGFEGRGKLLSIYFKALKSGRALVNFKTDSEIFLNDGSGSRASLTVKTADIEILPAGQDIPKDDWQNQISADNIPPEDFEIKIEKIEGKYFAIFSTIDMDSGLDRYEIKEGAGEWKRGSSPHLLKNQNLLNRISVKAVDKAGNEKISKILPQRLIYFWAVISMIILLCSIGLIRLITKKLKKK